MITVQVREEEQILFSTCETPYGTMTGAVSHPLDALCHLLATLMGDDDDEEDETHDAL